MPHTIIADTGSTKTEWIWLQDQQIKERSTTVGFNPFNSDGESFINAAQRALKEWPLRDSDLELYYYGTGTRTDPNKQKVKQLLRMLCPQAKSYHVNSDMIAACHACCGKEAGLVAILGTGTNSCVFDGQKIIDQLPSLGYISGDPASGYDLGKRLIQSYAWRNCPKEMIQELEAKYPEGIDQILKELYASVQPNVFLASFASYLIKFKELPFVKQLVSKAFDEFISSNLAKYDNPEKLSVSFVGSIAYYFENELSACLDRHGMRLGRIVRHPAEALATYIMKLQLKNG